MKKTILSIFFAMIMAFSFAQTEKHIAPDFTAITLDQDTIVLSELLAINKFVLLEFFFAENQFCQEISPIINESYMAMGENQEDVVFLSINVGNDSLECRNYMDTLGLENPIVAGIGGNGNYIDSVFDIQSYPTIILIGYETKVHDSTQVIDTIIDDEIIYAYDTIIGNDTNWVYNDDFYYYNIYENDIWPVYNSDSLVAVINKNLAEVGTGILDPFEKTEYVFNLYPNPSHGLINVQSPSISGLFDYQLIDISGKIIVQDKVNIPIQQSVELNFSWLNKGIYFLRLNNGQTELTKKLIIH